MIAGIPGIGISGIFYVLLVLAMPLFETIRFIGQRRSILWGFVGRQLGYVCGIIVALGLEAAGLRMALQSPLFIESIGEQLRFSDRMRALDADLIVPAFALSPFIALALVMVFTSVLRIVVRRNVAKH